MIKTLKHFFLPQTSNNYRPRLLHHKIILILTLFFFSAGLLSPLIKSNYPNVLGISSDVSIDQLLVLTNQKRQENGLPALSLNSKLDQAAQNKASDMLTNNYWAHISPTGTPPWYFIKNAGYSYVYAGENLARGYTTSSDVINAWMASSSHRENMLSNRYQNVGFAVLTGNLTGEDTVLVVEMFGSTALAQDNTQAQKIVSSETVVAPPTFTPTPTPITKLVATTLESKETTFVNNKIVTKPLVDAQTFSSNIAIFAITIFMFVLTLDMVIIERKKILRFVGHNLDHVIFFGLIFVFILIILRGYVI